MKVPGLYQACGSLHQRFLLHGQGSAHLLHRQRLAPSSHSVIDPATSSRAASYPCLSRARIRKCTRRQGWRQLTSRTAPRSSSSRAGFSATARLNSSLNGIRARSPKVGPLAPRPAHGPHLLRYRHGGTYARTHPYGRGIALNIHYKGAGRRGVITCGATPAHARIQDASIPISCILSVAFIAAADGTHPGVLRVHQGRSQRY